MHIPAYAWSHLSFRVYVCIWMCVYVFPLHGGKPQMSCVLWVGWLWFVGTVVFPSLFRGSCVFSSGCARKILLTTCPFCIACVCVCAHRSCTGHGAWYLYEPHVDLHELIYYTLNFCRGARPIISNLVQNSCERGSIKGRLDVYLHIWVENCWKNSSILCSTARIRFPPVIDSAEPKWNQFHCSKPVQCG